MLLAFSAKSEELDILMLSLTFGNVEVKKYVYTSCFCYNSLSTVRFCVEEKLFELGSRYMLDGCCAGERRDGID